MTTKTAKKAIRKQGPCAICGGPYAAHRLIDTQMERVAAGDHIEAVADDYDTNVSDMVTSWIALMELGK